MVSPSLNPALEALDAYPFRRLAELLDGLAPPAGVTPLNVAVGEPQHPTPAILTQALAAHSTEWNRYPPLAGTDAWGRAVVDWLTRRFELPKGALDRTRHVLPLAGSREGLYMAAETVIPRHKNGQRPAVLMPNPFYQVYQGAAVMAGAEPVFLPATAATSGLPDLAAVDEQTWARTAVVYFCNPANPQGAVASRDTLCDVITRVRRHGAVLLADECYSEIYRHVPPPGVLQACAALGDGFDNVLIFNSLSKRSSAAGLRCGVVAGDPALIAAFTRVRGYASAAVGIPVQAAAAALWSDEHHVIDNRARYNDKFRLAQDRLGAHFGDVIPPGGFFLWLKVGDGEAMARRLWVEQGLRVLPGAYLSHAEPGQRPLGHDYIRFALVHDLPVVAEALDRLLMVTDSTPR